MPFHLKSLGSYVYVKELEPGDTIDGEPLEEIDKGVLTFDDENGKNKKAVLDFVSGSDYDIPNLKELNTGWYVFLKWQNGRNRLIERPDTLIGMIHAEDEGTGIIRSYQHGWWEDGEQHTYLLPTSNPWGTGGNSIESGACERKGIIRMASPTTWYYERCVENLEMRWEFEEAEDPNVQPPPPPPPPPEIIQQPVSSNNSFYWNWIDLSDDSKPFFHMNNGAMYVYGGGVVLLILAIVLITQKEKIFGSKTVV